MTLQKLNIPPKTDNAAKKQMVQSNVIAANETLLASDVNAMVAKTNELVDAYNFGAPITAFNYKTTVATYADLPLTGNQVNDGYGVASEGSVYIWNGTAFPPIDKGLDLGLKPVGKVQSGDALAVSGGEVFDNIKPVDDALFTVIHGGTNLINELSGSDVANTELWVAGMLTNSGSVLASSGWFHSKKFYKLDDISYDVKLGMYGNSSICFYNSNFQFIGAKPVLNNDGSYYLNVSLTKLEGATYCKICHKNTYSTLGIYFKNVNVIKSPKSDVFIESTKLQSEVYEKLELNYIDPANQYISELIGSDINNSDLWGNGFLTASGYPSTLAGWKHSKKFYKIYKGLIRIKSNAYGNARNVVYDLNFNPVQIIASTTSNNINEVVVMVEQDGYIRLSHSTAYFNTSLISVENINVAKETLLKATDVIKLIDNNTKSFLNNSKKQFRSKKKRPLVTLISDDGRTENLGWYKEILDEFGVKSTFAIVGGWTRNADLDTQTNIMNSEQLRTLYYEGHDIASHTWTHTGNWNTALTPEQIEEEMSRTKVFLEKITTTPVNMFVSPFGIRSASIDNIISKYYDANFISGYGSINTLPLDNYFINRVSFDASESEPSLIWESSIKPAIDEAIANNNWLVLAIHPHYIQFTNWSNKEARKNELRTLLQYCKDNGIEITTAKKGYEYYKNYINIGVRRFDSKVYQLGMDGSEYNLNYFEQ